MLILSVLGIITYYIMWSFYIIDHNKFKGCEILRCRGLPILCQTNVFEVGLLQCPVDHET
jgi:hypothetical protein